MLVKLCFTAAAKSLHQGTMVMSLPNQGQMLYTRPLSTMQIHFVDNKQSIGGPELIDPQTSP